MRLTGEALELLETGRAAMTRFDLPVALDAMERCVALAPESVDAWQCLAMALMPRQPGKAAEALDKALRIDPRHVGVLFWRAEAEWLQDRPDAAARFLARLTELAPSSSTFGRLGFAYLAAGNRSAAEQAFEAAIRIGLPGVRAGVQHELRCAYYLEALGRHREAQKLIDDTCGTGLQTTYPAARYPRELEEQRCALEDMVAGRDVVILGSGPSLGELQPILESLGRDRAERLCFFGFNNVPVAERLIRDAVGRGVDLACMTSAHVMEIHHEWLASFFERGEKASMFCTLLDSLPMGRRTADMIRSRAAKVFYFAASADYPPIPGDPLHFPPINTLMCVLPLAVLAQPRQVFLFGCDGAVIRPPGGESEYYFRQRASEYGKQSLENALYGTWLARDTFFQNAMLPTVLASLSRLHDVPVCPIYNCNPDSAYSSFRKIPPSEFVSLYTEVSGPTGAYPAKASQRERQERLLKARKAERSTSARVRKAAAAGGHVIRRLWQLRRHPRRISRLLLERLSRLVNSRSR